MSKKIYHFIGGRVITWMIAGSIAAFLLSFIELLFAYVLQQILKLLGVYEKNEVILPKIFGEWNFTNNQVFVFFALVIVFKALFQLAVALIPAVAYVVLAARFRLIVFYKLLKSEHQKFIPASEVNYQITEIAQKTSSFCYLLSTLLNSTIQNLTLAGIMFWLTWQASLVGVVLISFVGVLLVKINRRIIPLAEQMPIEILSLNKGIQRVALNWFLIYILRMRNVEYDKLVNNELKYRQLDLRIARLHSITSILPLFFGSFILMIMIYLSIQYLFIETTVMISFLYIYLKFVQSLSQVSQVWGKLISVYPQFKISFSNYFELSSGETEKSAYPTNLITIFGSNIQYQSDPQNEKDLMEEIIDSPSLEIKDLYFSYGQTSDFVLSSINLKIDSGKQIGIIGRSGTGKSTLLALLLGILHPISGRVLLNDEDVKNVFLSKKLKIGYVGPEPFLFEGTLKENLEYGYKGSQPTDSDFFNALKAAHLYDHVISLSEGLEFKLQENGDGLSAGQKQRLCLARAILNTPKLLILDELSANLDHETELDIAESVKELKGKCTTLIVSHKPGILKHADDIFDLNKANKTFDKEKTLFQMIS